MATQARTFEQIVQFAPESTAAYGTPVAPDTVYPVTGGGGTPEIEEIIDSARRGISSMDFAAYQGSGHGNFSMEGFPYPDRFGWLLLAIMGTDAITGAIDPYTHTFGMASDPPSFTIQDIIRPGSNGALQFAGMRMGSLGLSFDSGSGVLQFTSEWQGGVPTKVTGASVSLGTVINAWPSWRCTATINAVANARIISADINFTRELDIVHTADGLQSARAVNVGPLAVEGTITLAFESMADIDLYLADTQQAFAITWTNGASPIRSLTINIPTCIFSGAPPSISRESVSVNNQLGIRGMYNASAPAGPANVVLLNNRATVYAAPA